jgi:hypothetical protein
VLESESGVPNDAVFEMLHGESIAESHIVVGFLTSAVEIGVDD